MGGMAKRSAAMCVSPGGTAERGAAMRVPDEHAGARLHRAWACHPGFVARAWQLRIAAPHHSGGDNNTISALQERPSCRD
jgi:hypothetical protein